MKHAPLLLALSLLCAAGIAQAADGLPLLADHTATRSSSDDAALPAASARAAGPAAANAQATTAKHAAARTQPPASSRAGGGAGADALPALPAGGNRPAAAQPLRARPVLGWQSLLPGSIQ